MEIKRVLKGAIANLKLLYIRSQPLDGRHPGAVDAARDEVRGALSGLPREQALEIGHRFIEDCAQACRDGKLEMSAAYSLALGVSDALSTENDIAPAKAAIDAFWTKEKRESFETPYAAIRIGTGFPIKEAARNLPERALPALADHYLGLFDGSLGDVGMAHAFNILKTAEDRILLSKKVMDSVAEQWENGKMSVTEAALAMGMFHALAGTVDGNHPEDRREINRKLYNFSLKAAGNIAKTNKPGERPSFAAERNARILSDIFRAHIQELAADEKAALMPVEHENVTIADFSEGCHNGDLCIVFHKAVNYHGQREPMVTLYRDTATLSVMEERLQGMKLAEWKKQNPEKWQKIESDARADECTPKMKTLGRQEAFLKKYRAA